MDIKVCTNHDCWEDLNPEVGQVVCFENKESGTKELKMWNGTGWDPVTMEANSKVEMTAYDINKQIIGQLPTLSDKDLGDAVIKINNYIQSCNNTFYMLLCKELSYYTVLMYDPANANLNDTMTNVLFECLQTIGNIKAIENVDGAIEIWFSNSEDTYAAYFFAYDRGVEKCR